MATSAAVSEVRAWAKTNGFDIGDRGRLPAEVWDAWSASTKPAKQPSTPRRAEPTPSPAVDQAELREAHQRIDRLEAQLEQVAARLALVEEQAHAQPQARRRFARNR